MTGYYPEGIWAYSRWFQPPEGYINGIILIRAAICTGEDIVESTAIKCLKIGMAGFI